MKPITRLSLGLFATWAIHDAEELATITKNSQKILPQVPAWVPLPVPKRIRQQGMSQKHFNVAVSIMAILVGAAAAEGVRTQGKSRFFRGAVLAFGVHGFTHIASAVAMRSYTSGVLTSPVVVIPYWRYAHHILQKHGLSDNDRDAIHTALLVLPVLLSIHGVVAWILER